MPIRLLLAPLGPAVVASSRVRVYQYLPYLAARGIEARVVPFRPRPPGHPFAELGRARRVAARVRTLERACLLGMLAPRYDVTLIQRTLLPVGLQRLLASRARRLVFDFDDAIYTTHPGMPVSARQARQSHPRFARMLALSSAVFASTPALAAAARRYNPAVRELPGPVDCDRYRPADGPSGPGVVVGWIGSPSTTMYLASVLPACRRLAARHPALRFEAVGADPGIDLAPFRVRPWSLDTELDHLRRFTIGIMPLSGDEWASAKGGYKLLQYMACGIASVASPVGVNADLLGDGERGLLAADEEGWERAVTSLVEDAGRRGRMGKAGRAFVEWACSLAVWAPRYQAALEEVARA